LVELAPDDASRLRIYNGFSFDQWIGSADQKARAHFETLRDSATPPTGPLLVCVWDQVPEAGYVFDGCHRGAAWFERCRTGRPSAISAFLVVCAHPHCPHGAEGDPPSAVARLPYAHLSAPHRLFQDFFFVFSRFEYAMKRSGYAREGKSPVEPAWWTLGERMRDLEVPKGSELDEAVTYLCKYPPLYLRAVDDWQPSQLRGETPFERAIDAAKTVRNNLFHGEKKAGPAAYPRDDALMNAALMVLSACLENNEALLAAYVE
jgi:hypothetical protein